MDCGHGVDYRWLLWRFVGRDVVEKKENDSAF